MNKSKNLLTEIKDELELKDINGGSWEGTLMHTYKFIMTVSGKSCSYSPLNNFYGKSSVISSCKKGGGSSTCR